MLVRIGQPSPVVEPATFTELFCPLDVRLRDIHAMGLVASFLQAGYDLADAAADIQDGSSGLFGLQRVRVLCVKGSIPTCQKLRVGFVLAIIRVLVTAIAHASSLADFRDRLS